MRNDDYTCPRCGGDIPNTEYKGRYSGALSRHAQGTEICSACGTDEAIRDISSTHDPLPRNQWHDRN